MRVSLSGVLITLGTSGDLCESEIVIRFVGVVVDRLLEIRETLEDPILIKLEHPHPGPRKSLPSVQAKRIEEYFPRFRKLSGTQERRAEHRERCGVLRFGLRDRKTYVVRVPQTALLYKNKRELELRSRMRRIDLGRSLECFLGLDVVAFAREFLTAF